MRRWAFVIAILGIFILILFLGFNSKKIKSVEELENLEINSRVSVSGIVENERAISNGRKILTLQNGIVLVCECSGIFLNEEISVEGVVSEFEEVKQIEILKIFLRGNDS